MVITPTLPQSTEPRPAHHHARHGSRASGIDNTEEPSSATQPAGTEATAVSAAVSNNGISEPSAATAALLSSLAASIPDAESAQQSTALARTHLLTQSATAMLAQANLDPQTVMNLLQ